MVDFEKLRINKKKEKIIEPSEIFRRLPKPPGINDLYTSQSEVLHAWFDRRKDKDVVLKLHTGGGKTLVGLLIAQSSLVETGEPVLYLTPTTQLVRQTIEKAKAHGIPAVAYERGQPLNDDFVNANAIMVATYNALFNGKSKFGLRGGGLPQSVSSVICDDAHAAFSVVREAFTLEVKSKDDRPRYEALSGLFRRVFKDIDKLGTFDDIITGSEYAVLEVPYWAWHEQLDAIREQLKTDIEKYALSWPMLRDQLHLCHALISRHAFTITPFFPLVNLFPTFSEAQHRIYMSATIANDSEIIRTFDASPQGITNALTSKSLAGISERMILIPALMPFKFDVHDAIVKIINWATEKCKLGTVILVPSDKVAQQWKDVAFIASNPQEVEYHIKALQNKDISKPIVFENRYDGIDLPGDSCRLLIMSNLPTGTSNYELFRASSLYGGKTITRILAQRIEQGIGRGARGAGDHCVVLFAGADLAAWISKDTNLEFLTNATKAQLEMGAVVSKEVKNLNELAQTIYRSFMRDTSWVAYHAEALAELVDEDKTDNIHLDQAAAERKSFDLWCDNYHGKAIAKIEKYLAETKGIDSQSKGWMEQFAARIASQWGNGERAEELQRLAFADNRNLLRPKVLPTYRPIAIPGSQASCIVRQIGGYRYRRGFLHTFEDTVAHLCHSASANQFEQALADLATMIGFSAERHDTNGEGPDVLWILPDQLGVVIEAKSRKLEKNALTKQEHGQLLIAAEWFKKNYPNFQCIRVSVHPKNQATRAAVAGASHALTYEKLAELVTDARILLTSLCESQLSNSELSVECFRLLDKSPINADCLVKNYFEHFKEIGETGN